MILCRYIERHMPTFKDVRTPCTSAATIFYSVSSHDGGRLYAWCDLHSGPLPIPNGHKVHILTEEEYRIAEVLYR